MISSFLQETLFTRAKCTHEAHTDTRRTTFDSNVRGTTELLQCVRTVVKWREVKSEVCLKDEPKLNFEICKLVELRNVTYSVRNKKCGGWGGTRRWRDCVFACVMLSPPTMSILTADYRQKNLRLSKFTGDFLERMVRCNGQCCKSGQEPRSGSIVHSKNNCWCYFNELH